MKTSNNSFSYYGEEIAIAVNLLRHLFVPHLLILRSLSDNSMWMWEMWVRCKPLNHNFFFTLLQFLQPRFDPHKFHRFARNFRLRLEKEVKRRNINFADFFPRQWRGDNPRGRNEKGHVCDFSGKGSFRVTIWALAHAAMMMQCGIHKASDRNFIFRESLNFNVVDEDGSLLFLFLGRLRKFTCDDW